MNTLHAAQPATIIPLDEYGLLKEPDSWDKHIAQQLASQLDIGTLTEDHWIVIEALRTYYQRFGVAPSMHTVCHSSHHGEDWVHNLFHSCLNAWRVSGLPDPGEEAKAYLNDM